MNAGSLLLAVGCGCAIAGSPALAQVHDIVFSPDNDDTHGARNVDCGVAVSADVFVVSSNMTLGLYERDGTLIEQFDADDSMNFPFVVNDRLWIMYSEETTTGAAMARPIHVAVSKTADPESLDSSAWWFYTGVGMSAGNGGEAIQAGPSGAIDIDHCFMSIDHQACYIVGQTHDGFGIPGVSIRDHAVIIPLAHGDEGELSILDGDRPAFSDITVINLGDASIEDFSSYHCAVQEPFDQFEDAQFVITTVNPTPPSLEQTHIRLGAIYYNSSISDWDYNFADIDLPGTSYNYYNSNIGDPPATPDSGGWGPATSRHYFESAVLMWPDSNTPLIFATHHIKASDSTSGSNPHIVQWYVINPDLANFDGTWSPSIMTNGIGRIPSSGDSDAYFPVIGVTAQGDAYLEYTLSDDETYPEIRRAAFNSSYTGISSDNQVQPGPDLAYDEPDPAAWADYSDMQADPISCGLWSMHVLVFDPEDSSTLTDARDVWVFENQITCTNAEMNGDGLVDETDLYLFNQYHLAGSRQADMNRDQTLDAIDVALYYDEYAKRSK